MYGNTAWSGILFCHAILSCGLVLFILKTPAHYTSANIGHALYILIVITPLGPYASDNTVWSGILFCHAILSCGPVLFIRAHRWSNTLFDNDNYCVVRYSILARDIIIWSGTIHPKTSEAHRLSNTAFDKDNIGWSGTLFTIDDYS